MVEKIVIMTEIFMIAAFMSGTYRLQRVSLSIVESNILFDMLSFHRLFRYSDFD